MDNTNSFYTEEECFELLHSIRELCSSDSKINLDSLEEFNIYRPINNVPTRSLPLGIGVASAAAVAIIISSLIKYIKSKYSLDIQKLVSQSKELNDIYTKVNDILAHDRMARFKHRNDMVDYEMHYVILKDSRNPKDDYRLDVDNIFYDPEYFIKEINEIMEYVNTYSKENKTDDILKMKENLLRIIDENFENSHTIIKYCTPMMKIAKYSNVKLENCIKSYKEVIGGLYNSIYLLNNNVSIGLQNLNLMKQAYDKLLYKFGKDKDGKAMIDEVFKKLLDNSTKSMEFNEKIISLFESMIRFYTDELTKVYDAIRN